MGKKGLLFLFGVLLAGGFVCQHFWEEKPDCFYQGGTFAALLAGNYNQMATIGHVKEKGDFGLGVFDLLDGEMIVLDGRVYQADSKGNVQKMKNDAGSPFYAVTDFSGDMEREIGQVEGLYQLCKELDKIRKRDDVIYAIKIQGQFAYIKVGAFAKQYYPYPPLETAKTAQAVFEYEDVSGTLVGFWLPDCMGTINQPGYHFHFLSDDKQKGGHLLEIAFEGALVQFDEMVQMEVEFSGVMTVPGSAENTMPTLAMNRGEGGR